jgi:hypothetical protein
MLLPSHAHGPQASPHLLRADDEGAAPGRPDRLDPWVVAAATFGAADAVDFLLGLAGADEPGLAIGDSPRVLAELSKLALELLARGRVVPALARRDDQWVARWEPFTIDPGDSERLALLTESMPPLLRRKPALPSSGRRRRRSSTARSAPCSMQGAPDSVSGVSTWTDARAHVNLLSSQRAI